MWMRDEAGPDAKIICVEPQEPRFRPVHDITDLYPELLQEIENFFDVYKTLEPDKYSETGGFEGRDAAWDEIRACRSRYPG
jgi:inorganic pyrophosphatase